MTELTDNDYQAMAIMFGFTDWQEFKAFTQRQQAKADYRNNGHFQADT